MPRERSQSSPQQDWEAPSVPTALEDESPHLAQRFLLFLSESLQKGKAALALLWFFRVAPRVGSSLGCALPHLPARRGLKDAELHHSALRT